MYNKAIIIGRLTAEPELKATGSGIHVTGFTVAVDRRMSKDKQADFISIVAWRQTAEFVCKYFHKGDPIGIEGNIQTRQYEDKQGNKRTAVEIVADSVFFVSGKGTGQGAGNAPQDLQTATRTNVAALQGEFEEIETDDDLPF